MLSWLLLLVNAHMIYLSNVVRSPSSLKWCSYFPLSSGTNSIQSKSGAESSVAAKLEVSNLLLEAHTPDHVCSLATGHADTHICLPEPADAVLPGDTVNVSQGAYKGAEAPIEWMSVDSTQAWIYIKETKYSSMQTGIHSTQGQDPNQQVQYSSAQMDVDDTLGMHPDWLAGYIMVPMNIHNIQEKGFDICVGDDVEVARGKWFWSRGTVQTVHFDNTYLDFVCDTYGQKISIPITFCRKVAEHSGLQLSQSLRKQRAVIQPKADLHITSCLTPTMLGHILYNPPLPPSEKYLCERSEKWMALAIFFLRLQAQQFVMSTMNKHKTHINADEVVCTSQADEIELVDAISLTTLKQRPHILRLQFPTSIQNVTVSFEPKSQGPVTIEISLTSTSPELTAIVDPSHTTRAQTRLAHNFSSTDEVKLEPADANLSASMGPLHMEICNDDLMENFMPNVQEPLTGCTMDSAPTGDNHIESASAQHIVPRVLLVGDSEIELENDEGTPRPVEKMASELPATPPPTTTCWSLKHGFTPDSFAGSEEFDSISMQVLCERWNQIREELIARQKCRKPIFSEDTTPPLHKHYRK
ncbi:hypothetical protein EDC04DRAFT_2602044 [Pisolithus marmoratus]|nr:hypothetical protein EDC04DRAFT_2602044 [Pisolithus marmoratus]